MFTRERISFFVFIALVANCFYFLSKIGETPTVSTFSAEAPPSGNEKHTSAASTLQPPLPAKIAPWDDAAAVTNKTLACAEWGPLPDDRVIEAKTVLVGSNLKERIMVKESPSAGSWGVVFALSEDQGKRKEQIQKNKASKLEIIENSEGRLFGGPFQSESVAKAFAENARQKTTLPFDSVMMQPPSRNTTFILTDVSDEPLIAMKKASKLVGAGEIRATPCPGAIGVASAEKNK